MRTYAYQVVNVFAEHTFGGNPLAVLLDARGLSGDEMLAITEQFNLSETAFLLPSSTGAARVRIFSPGYEMNFAGHPTLGASAVLRSLQQLPDTFELELNVGLVQVSARGDFFELRARPATVRECTQSPAEVAAMLSLPPSALAGPLRWVSCGSEQLLIALRSSADVRQVRPLAQQLFEVARNQQGQVMAYVFAEASGGQFEARFFWEQGGAVREDAGTGSAAANLGGYLNAEQRAVPSTATIRQGLALNRLNVLSLRRDDAQQIFVGGRVCPLMRGELSLP
jgi:PhzF family phenazine biosynthesis protein